MGSCTTRSPPPPSCRKSMEEDVRKDLSLSCLHSCSNNSTISRPASFGAMVFPDFLPTTPTLFEKVYKDEDPPPPPATAKLVVDSNTSLAPLANTCVLSLNSRTRSDHLQHLPLIESTSLTTRPTPFVTNFVNSSSCTNVALDSSTQFPSYYKRGPLDPDQNRDDEYHSSGNRRHKRMMKNRESAARSRARKQELFSPAYADALELEVALLRKENARLKRQQVKFCLTASIPPELPNRHVLGRTSSAPF